MPGPRRLPVLAAMVAVAVLSGAGCATGFDAQTNYDYQPAVGTNSRQSDVFALNVFAVSGGEEEATLVGSLLNKADSEDALIGLEAFPSDGAPMEASFDSEVVLPPEHLVQLTEGTPIEVTGPGARAGSVFEIELTFRNAAPVRIEVPVLRPTGPYATAVPTG